MTNEDPTSVLHLIDLLQIQSGAVVSRTLLNQKSGTITLFAFDQGEGLSEHTAPYAAFVQVIEGDLDITIAGTLYPLSAGDMISDARQRSACITGEDTCQNAADHDPCINRVSFCGEKHYRRFTNAFRLYNKK